MSADNRYYRLADHAERQYIAAYRRGDTEAMRYWAKREAHYCKIANELETKKCT